MEKIYVNMFSKPDRLAEQIGNIGEPGAEPYSAIDATKLFCPDAGETCKAPACAYWCTYTHLKEEYHIDDTEEPCCRHDYYGYCRKMMAYDRLASIEDDPVENITDAISDLGGQISKSLEESGVDPVWLAADLREISASIDRGAEIINDHMVTFERKKWHL